MRISNCQLVFAIARAARVPCLLADLGIDAHSERVATYCERVSARDGRVVRDILDLSLRDLAKLAIAIENAAADSSRGGVIPGYTDTLNSPECSSGKGFNGQK